MKHNGKPIRGGAFAVAKNKDEDRAISSITQVNSLVDGSKLWPPKFARMVSLRCLTMKNPRNFLRLSKRDARHFSIASRWAGAGINT